MAAGGQPDPVPSLEDSSLGQNSKSQALKGGNVGTKNNGNNLMKILMNCGEI